MLYDVEDQIKLLDDAERLSRRQSLSRHVLQQIEEYLASSAMQSPTVLPKSNLGQAAAYVRRHWESLCRFIDDASVPIDNKHFTKELPISALGRWRRSPAKLAEKSAVLRSALETATIAASRTE